MLDATDITKTVNGWSLRLSPLWKWVQHHPGTLVIGALLVVAILAAPAHRESPPADLTTEDVPLFI